MEFRRRRRSERRLDITALIDVVLLLVIFFMISTSFIVQPGIKVKLPEAGTREEGAYEDLVVLITKEGELYYRDAKVTDAELRQRLEADARAEGESVLVIKADEQALHGRVVKVMDMAKAEGITRLAIATTPKPEE